jgi:hypothetical protein
MNDVAQSPPKILWTHLAVTCALAGFLTWADGRLWPKVQDPGSAGLWLFLGLQTLLGTWAYRFWLGRLLAALVNGVLLWRAIGWTRSAFADPERGPIALSVAALLLACIAANFVWARMPNTWKARFPTLKVERGVGGLLLAAVVGSLISLMLITVLSDLDVAGRWGVAGATLMVAVGLALALWRLNGWPRAFACWAILSLAWIGLMTSLAVSVVSGAVASEDWLLALLPPLIVGVVMGAYWRIHRSQGI